ncbi:MAG: porin [Moraxellaceae bacterium]|nr:MAG: porin [Moraxellaceae bacterium]
MSIVTAGFLAVAGAEAGTLGTFEGTTVTLGGYIKLDAIFSQYSDGTLANGSLGRDFYVPSLTPIGGKKESTQLDMHARQSRINFGTSSTVDGVALKTFVEMDFMATTIGDDRVTNGYAPELRLAFLTYGNWMFGQNWSTFQNTASLPDTADFIGNTDAGIFVRQAQVRYTHGNWQFALENPETTITPDNKGGARVVADDNALPDLVGRYNLTAGDLTMSFAALARQLVYVNGPVDSSTSAYGVSVTGKLMVGKDDIRFGVNAGSGMGRYIGLNTANDAVLDAQGDLQAIDSLGYFASYRHLWDDQWRSNITYSALQVDNDLTLTGLGATESTASVRVNLFYSPTPKLSFGGEITHAVRSLESDADGSMDRLQFSVKLDF